MSNGTYGVGPDCDTIVALIGGPSPYVLRPKGKGYLTIGPAYTDELVDGMYFRNLRGTGMEEQQFTLV